MNWLAAVIIGHLLNALGFVLNKAALTVSIKNPKTFTFYIGFLGAVSAVFLFLAPGFPQIGIIPELLIGGVFFMLALYCFLVALSGSDTSRVAPFIGALVPIFTFVFEYFWIGNSLSRELLIAFVVLIIGTIIVTIDIDAEKNRKGTSVNSKVNTQAWIYGTIAAASFGLSFVASKLAYDALPFWNAFAWMRIISFVAVLAFLLFPGIAKDVWNSRKIFTSKAGGIYLGSQAVGAVSFIFINYAISKASVSLVNAMQGIQYALLIVLVLVGHVIAPKLVQEAMSKKSLALRSVGVVVICVGIALVSLNQ